MRRTRPVTVARRTAAWSSASCRKRSRIPYGGTRIGGCPLFLYACLAGITGCARLPPECTFQSAVPMAGFEWMVVAYFSALTLAAWLRPVGSVSRRKATSLGSAVVLTVFVVAMTGSSDSSRVGSHRLPLRGLLDAGAVGDPNTRAIV